MDVLVAENSQLKQRIAMDEASMEEAAHELEAVVEEREALQAKLASMQQDR